MRRPIAMMVAALISVGAISLTAPAITAVTNYFDTTKIVSRDLVHTDVYGDGPWSFNLWCPQGYRVTSGGLGTAIDDWLVRENRPIVSGAKQGWRLTVTRYVGYGGNDPWGRMYAICVK